MEFAVRCSDTMLQGFLTSLVVVAVVVEFIPSWSRRYISIDSRSSVSGRRGGKVHTSLRVGRWRTSFRDDSIDSRISVRSNRVARVAVTVAADTTVALIFRFFLRALRPQ
jgi:hypothetical protein